MMEEVNNNTNIAVLIAQAIVQNPEFRAMVNDMVRDAVNNSIDDNVPPKIEGEIEKEVICDHRISSDYIANKYNITKIQASDYIAEFRNFQEILDASRQQFEEMMREYEEKRYIAEMEARACRMPCPPRDYEYDYYPY